MSDHNPPPPPRLPPLPADHWSNSDMYMIHNYKVDYCPISTTPHDFAMCPFTHVGDIYRRHPGYYNHEYCRADMDHTGKCYRGDQCPNAHGFYEYNYHPSRYRTMPCIYFGTNDCPFFGCPFYHFGYQRRTASPNHDGDPNEREGPSLQSPRPDGNNPVLSPQQIPPSSQIMQPLPPGCFPTGAYVFRPSSSTRGSVFISQVPPPRNIVFMRPSSSTGGNVFGPNSSTGGNIIRTSPGVNIFGPSSSAGANVFRPNSATSFWPIFSTGGNVFRPSSATSAAIIRDSSSTTGPSRDPAPRPAEGQ